MDEAGIDAKGIDSAEADAGSHRRPEQTSRSCRRCMGRLHNNGVNALFAFGSEPDAKDSMMEIAGTDQGGLGLARSRLLPEDR